MADVDTARILVDWTCNLKCPYCCNEQERFRSPIKPVTLDEIDFNRYQNFCISGGEPLMFMSTVAAVCERIPREKFIVLYTNGILMDVNKAVHLEDWGVAAINVGLHYPATFEKIIRTCQESVRYTHMSMRYHVWEKYKELKLEEKFPNIRFRYWTLDDCDRENEERFILRHA